MFIAFRLKPGRDDDLIAWVSSLGQDERSIGIRHALRSSITGSGKIQGYHVPKIMPRSIEQEDQDKTPINLEENLDSWF